MSDSPVGIQVIAIPDGLVAGADGKVRLSLVLTPITNPNGSAAKVKLENWPSEITKRLGSLKIKVAEQGKADQNGNIIWMPIKNFSLARSEPSSAGSTNADTLWNKQIFTNFAALLHALAQKSDQAAALQKALQSIIDVLKQAARATPAAGAAPPAGAPGPDSALAPNSAAPTPAPAQSSNIAILDALKNQRIELAGVSVGVGPPKWSQTRYLTEAVNSFHDDSHLLRLLALTAAHQQRTSGNVKSEHPLMESLSANGQQNSTLAASLNDIFDGAAAWVNAAAVSFATTPFQQRVLPSLQDSVLKLLMTAGLGNPPGDAFGQLKSLAAQSDRTRKAVAARSTIIQQALAQDQHSTIETVLQKTLGLAPASDNRTNAELGEAAKLETAGHFVQPKDSGKKTMRGLFGKAAAQHAHRSEAVDAESELAAFTGDRQLQQVAKNLLAFYQHWQNKPVTPRAPKITTVTKEDDDAARRKFFGIRALPALAKYLRFTLDVEFDLACLSNHDMVTASFDEFDDSQLWTKFEQQDSQGKTCFRPASAPNGTLGLDYALPIVDGVVNLRVLEVDKTDPRFSVTILDLPSAIGSLRHKAEQDAGAQRDGTILDSISTKQPERQARGLQLIDNEAHAQIAAANVPSTPPPGDARRPFFAEDLVIAYRPYIRRSSIQSSGKVRTFPWRSLVARTIHIDGVPDYFGNPVDERLRLRNHGYVRPATKLQASSSDPSNQADPTTDGQMFAWMGASLALSANINGTQSTAPFAANAQSPNQDPNPGDPNSDLPLNIDYGFSNDSQDRLPSLRVGDNYLMGLAPVYPNCGGPTHKEAASAFDNDNVPVTTGDQHNNPLTFGPPRNLPPPVILISEVDAKLWQSTEKDDPAKRGNAENALRIVLRSPTNPKDHKNTKDSAIRYFVPPRATFEVAEQSGMFDKMIEPTPPGAFNDYQQDPILGGFTSDGPVYSPKQHTPPDTTAVSRSAVLKPSGYAQPCAPYYPDPLARNMQIAFERKGATPPGYPDAVPPQEFWQPNASPVTAKPIELLVKRWNGGRSGGQIDFADNKGNVGLLRKVDRLTIEVAQAEEVNLRFWCVPDLTQLLRSQSVLNQHIQTAVCALLGIPAPGSSAAETANSVEQSKIRAVADFASGQKLPTNMPGVERAFQTVFAALTKMTPDNGINNWLAVKVVHAVEKPLAVPAIPLNEKSKDANKLAIQPIRLQQKTAWQDYIVSKNPLAIPSDPSTAFSIPSEENGSTTYFVGLIDFDRPSTGELRIEASWPETDPSQVIQAVKPPRSSPANYPKKFTLNQANPDRPLFSQPIRVPRDQGSNPDGQIDLTFDETGLLRGLNYPFTDTFARKISLRIVGTSRFMSDFPDDGKPKSDDAHPLGRFDVESRPPMGSKRAKEPSADFRTYDIIVPATAAPPAVVVSRLEWVMPERLTAFEPGRRLCVEKNFYPRLYLGQDWCRFGECLAVICMPEDFATDRSPDAPPSDVLKRIPLSFGELLSANKVTNISAWDFTKQPDKQDGNKYYGISENVSRWGSDPTIQSGALTGTITRDRVTGFSGSVSNVTLPGSGSAGPNVCLLLYQPIFDVDTGEFYVDIGIDPGAAHAPIIQLVVARYQMHTIKPHKPEFGLSSITRVRPFQVAPKREVEVIIHDERSITTIVKGVGYNNRNPETPQWLAPKNHNGKLPDDLAKLSEQIRYPLQNVRVIRFDEAGSTSGIQVYNEFGLPLSINRISPQFYHPEMIWISDFKLPFSLAKNRCGLQIEEVDLHFADRAYEDEVPNPQSHVVERLGSFSLTVDLEKGLYLEGGGRETEVRARG